MDAGLGVFFGLALGVGGSLGAIFRARTWVKTRDGRRRRRVDRLPTVRIADVEPGAVVKIVGTVEAIVPDGAAPSDAPLLEAPLTGQRALAFVTSVDIHDETQRGSPGSFTPYRREKQARDFRVRDESGVAIVRVHGADIIAEPHPVPAEAERQRRWLRKVHGRSRFLFVVPRKLVYAETALRPGAEVVVLGRCAASPAAAKEGPYREGGGDPVITVDATRAGGVEIGRASCRERV